MTRRTKPLEPPQVLEKYLKENKLSQEEFGGRVGVYQSMVSQWVTGECRFTAERATQIEQVTKGAIKRHELRPDIFEVPQVA